MVSMVVRLQQAQQGQGERPGLVTRSHACMSADTCGMRALAPSRPEGAQEGGQGPRMLLPHTITHVTWRRRPAKTGLVCPPPEGRLPHQEVGGAGRGLEGEAVHEEAAVLGAGHPLDALCDREVGWRQPPSRCKCTALCAGLSAAAGAPPRAEEPASVSCDLQGQQQFKQLSQWRKC